MIYIPLPDEKSRENIIKAVTRKSPVAPDVYLDFIAKCTDGFSGADLAELVQNAAKYGIKDAIFSEKQKISLAAEAGQEPMDLEGEAGVATITRVHFEQAMATARKSVTNTDLTKYE